VNYDDEEKEKITLSFQKNPENDGTSRVDISGSEVLTRQQLCVLCDTERPSVVCSWTLCTALWSCSRQQLCVLCDTERPSVVCSWTLCTALWSCSQFLLPFTALHLINIVMLLCRTSYLCAYVDSLCAINILFCHT